MGLYKENGYLNYKYICDVGQRYIDIIGGRGIGKSHLICDIWNESKLPILYVRRTNVALENSFSTIGDFVKPDWFGKDIRLKYNDKKGYGKAYLTDEDLQNDKPFIVGVSLSTFQNKTGIDFTRFYDVIFDEFIPQKGDRSIKNEFQAYKNIMEVLFRNRPESETEKIRTWFFGNSNAIMSNILIGYRLIPDCYKAVKERTEITQVDRCETTLILPFNSPVSEKKRQNAFYRNLPKGRAKMELDNEFMDLEDDRIRHQNLKEYTHDMKTPLFSVWLHKSDFKFYITKPMKAHCEDVFDASPSSLERWQSSSKKYLKPMFISGDITFSDYETQCDFLASFDCVSWYDIL